MNERAYATVKTTSHKHMINAPSFPQPLEQIIELDGIIPRQIVLSFVSKRFINNRQANKEIFKRGTLFQTKS